MVTVSSEKDRVVWALSSRGSDLILTPDQARRLVELTSLAASDCELWVKAGGSSELIRGEARSASVKSWDGRVNIRFSQATKEERIPYEAARRLAAEIDSRITEAENRMTIVWGPNF